ncbi:unnamed protein product [Effrenium voratum]|nr:unnamed protein product [Effrenium voratum]
MALEARAPWLLVLALAALASVTHLQAFTGVQVARVTPAPRVAARAVEKSTMEDEDEEEEEEGEEEEEEEEIEDDEGEEVLKKDYAFDENVPKSWYKHRAIDRHKVNMKFFDMFKKPVDFFPHKLQAGDTVRVYYLEAKPGQGDKEMRGVKLSKDQLRETYFDGTVVNFRGDYHARTMTVRAMIGKGLNSVGYEFQFPMHSPLITRMQVLRRGFIGRNKNAYFLRGMVGKRNVIPLDEVRTKMDETYASLRVDGREDEIPSPEYPKNEWETYPLPVWQQDMPEWDEKDYDPDKVDQRSEYELRVIAKYKMRKSRSGKYGTPR